MDGPAARRKHNRRASAQRTRCKHWPCGQGCARVCETCQRVSCGIKRAGASPSAQATSGHHHWRGLQNHRRFPHTRVGGENGGEIVTLLRHNIGEGSCPSKTQHFQGQKAAAISKIQALIERAKCEKELAAHLISNNVSINVLECVRSSRNHLLVRSPHRSLCRSWRIVI